MIATVTTPDLSQSVDALSDVVPKRRRHCKPALKKSPKNSTSYRKPPRLTAPRVVNEQPFGCPPLPAVCRFRETSPFRPPNWRWAMATYLLDHGDNTSSMFHSDQWIAPLFRFAESLRACRGQSVEYDGVAAEPLLMDAFKIYSGPRTLERTLLEAWILTGLPSSEIAAKTSIPVEVIDQYEVVFFHVRDRLDSRYVEQTVLKLHPTPEPTLDNILKGFARRGGPFVLELLVKHLVMPNSSATQVSDIFHFIKDHGESEESLLVRLSVGMWLMEITPDNAAKALRLLTRMRRQRKSSSSTPIEENLRVFAAGLHKTLGSMPVEK